MRPLRPEPLADLVITADLAPLDCLETIEFVVRQAAFYGLDPRLEVRRNRSGRPDDRHFVLCHADDEPSWVMHLVLTPLGPNRTHLTLGLARFRRATRGITDGRLAQSFLATCRDALTEATLPRRSVAANVIAIRNYAVR